MAEQFPDRLRQCPIHGQQPADASDRPGCPRELPTADEVWAWLDEDPDVEGSVFLAHAKYPFSDFLAYPVTAVPALILAALRRWGCDPQFSAEEVALNAAPWSLLEPPPALPGRSIAKEPERIGDRKELSTKSGPTPVSEQMPEPGIKVIAHYLNDLGNGRTIMAEWVPAKSRKDDNDEDFAEYDEDDEEFYWPEGWYEVVENSSDYCALLVDKKITHWRPLPASPYQDKKTNG
jgi:hypothetical protein